MTIVNDYLGSVWLPVTNLMPSVVGHERQEAGQIRKLEPHE